MIKKKIIISIIVVIVVAVISAGAWFWFNQEKENNLEEPIPNEGQSSEEPIPNEGQSSGEPEFYSEQYNLDSIKNVEGITSEMLEQYKDKFIEYQDKLEEAIKNYEKNGKKVEEKPNPDFFIEKARYSNYLGQTDWAIDILNSVFDYYQNSSVAWNNLAKLYEEKEDYTKANEYYFKIINTFGEKQFWGQYYYVTKNYMALGDKEKVKEYYAKYKSLGGQDSEIEDYLTK